MPPLSQVEPPPADPAHRCCSSFRESGRHGGKWLVGIPGCIDTLLSYISSAFFCYRSHHPRRIRSTQGALPPPTHVTLHEDYTAVLEEIRFNPDWSMYNTWSEEKIKNKKKTFARCAKTPSRALSCCTCPCSRWGWRPAHPS